MGIQTPLRASRGHLSAAGSHCRIARAGQGTHCCPVVLILTLQDLGRPGGLALHLSAGIYKRESSKLCKMADRLTQMGLWTPVTNSLTHSRAVHGPGSWGSLGDVEWDHGAAPATGGKLASGFYGWGSVLPFTQDPAP